MCPTIRVIGRTVIVAVAILAGPIPTRAAGDAEHVCRVGRYAAAAKYNACEQKVLGKNTGLVLVKLAKCRIKYANTWAKLQAKATGTGSTCDNPRFDTSVAGTVIDRLTGLQWEKKVLEASSCPASQILSGGYATTAPLSTTGTFTARTTTSPGPWTGTATNSILGGPSPCSGTLSGSTLTGSCSFSSATVPLSITIDCTAPAGDNPVTLTVGSPYVGSGAGNGVGTDPHRDDDAYTLSVSSTVANGSAFTIFLPALNGGGCFAGQCDWRLPTVYELQTILDPEPFTGSSCIMPSCIDPAFGPTAADFYWSAPSDAANPIKASAVFFGTGLLLELEDTALLGPLHVRAVRGGL